MTPFTVRRILCALLGCVPMPGITRRLSITFCCHRCGALADGDLSINR